VYRSSALASKATGYPIAKIATKLALGYNLDELQNKLQINFGFIRTDFDYVIVKYRVGTLINSKELTELGASDEICR
jgi:carbamoylphosphate synthase large subunit